MHMKLLLISLLIFMLYSCKSADSSLGYKDVPWMIMSPSAAGADAHENFELMHVYSNGISRFADIESYEKSRIDEYKRKITYASEPKKEKYKQQLKQYIASLQNQFKKNTNGRMLFLQKFYSDLYQLTNKEFTKKYKRHCSRDILDELKYKYRLYHGRKGYAWNIFTDNEKHAASEFRFAYLNGNPDNVTDKQEALFMFGDSVKRKEPEYRYTNAEDKWYRVSMGNHYVMVQVEGVGKDMLVTGISNPYTNSIIKAQEEKVYNISYGRKKGGVASGW